MRKGMFIVRAVMIAVAIAFALLIGVAIGSGGAVRVLTLLLAMAIAVTVACMAVTNTVILLATRRSAKAAQESARMAEEAKRLAARASALTVLLDQPGEVFEEDVCSKAQYRNAPYNTSDVRRALGDLLGVEVASRRISETGGAWWSVSDRGQAELFLLEVRAAADTLSARATDLKIDSMADARLLRSQANRLQKSLSGLGFEDER